MKVRVTEGKKALQIIRSAKKAQGVKMIQVGFYATATYDDGTPVTSVAAWNEFGTRKMKERPYFRTANRTVRKKLAREMYGRVNPLTMAVDKPLANDLGLIFVREIQEQITKFQVIDTGHLKQSTDYKIVE